MSQFNIFQGNDNQFYWQLSASNGETLCHSEGYTSKQSVQNAIESFKTNAVSDAQFTISQGNDNQFYWNLKAANGEILVQSEGYTTQQSAQNGVNSVQNSVSQANVVDETLTNA